ncbi:MAG: peptide deformylase [Candidatus Levybacteria bacterium]|nr:peptide deformylase [Candidatus Levybacteria bacterium]
MQLTVREPSDQLLRKECTPIPKRDLRKTSVQEEIEAMIDYVYGTNNKGKKRKSNQSMTVGLSANQVGLSKRISIVDMAIGKRGYSDIQVLINPEIIWASTSMVEHGEGCVNLPSIWGYVMRSKRIKVKALDRSGNELLLTLVGWPAILLQHEIDHLNGKLFIDKLIDPKKAHLVEKNDYRQYKTEKKNWTKYIDVSKYIKPE